MTARVLEARRNRLQHLVLEISCQDRALGLFASDLARARLANGEVDDILTALLYTESPAFRDRVLTEIKQRCLLSKPAIFFLTELIKDELRVS